MFFEDRLQQELNELQKERDYTDKHSIPEAISAVIRGMRLGRNAASDRESNRATPTLDLLLTAIRVILKKESWDPFEGFLRTASISFSHRLENVARIEHKILWLLYWKLVQLQANSPDAPDLDNV